MRVRIDFSYDGTDFSGWAAQPGLRTVETELTSGLERVLRRGGIKLTVAGRTDAGVHARGGVCHFDVDAEAWSKLPGRSDRSPSASLTTRLNGVLPPDIVVRDVSEQPEAFDARFSALRRRYSYRLLDDASLLDPVRRRDTVVVKRPLDVDAMNAAAATLTGLHDFSAYCKQREGASTIRTLLAYAWHRGDDSVVTARLEADAFCHSMVRALVGACVAVGEGRREPGWARGVLERGQRDPGVTVMPAHGLCLEEVSYPSADQFAARDAASRVMRTAADLA